MLQHLKEQIARLDPGSFTALVGSLMVAEAIRLRLSPNDVVASDALSEADEGLDALVKRVPLEAPDGPASTLPPGEVGLQYKATKKKNPSAFDLKNEMRKVGPRRLIVAGSSYVLVSSQDLNPAQRRALEDAVRDEAAAICRESDSDATPSTAVWDAETLAILGQLYPGSVVDFGLSDFGHAQSLPELMDSLRALDRPFESDPSRDSAIEQLRARIAANDEEALLMIVQGDPGAGKTRTVAHGLDTDDLRDSVLYINGTEGLQLLLTRLTRLPSSAGILFADEIEDRDATEAARRLSGQRGRWHVVAVTSRTSSRWVPNTPRSLVLPPLEADATRRLVEKGSGLSEAQARVVADVAAGFPELAFALAEQLRDDPGTDLVTLARSPRPDVLFRRALGDPEARRHLAPLALFAAVGAEEELRHELEAVARAFELDPDQVQRHCDAEVDRGRFVSRAGRYRMITPRLVAIWLATELIEQVPRIEERILSLPDALQQSFISQLEFFGPTAPHLPEALRRVLENERFRRPAAFDEAAGRFLRASAAIVPEQVAESVRDLLTSATETELATMPRRDLVWTLEILLWWPTTWEVAVDGLYRLAQRESETWSNNATNEFASAFSIYLSGSTVPYRERAAWLERRLAEATPQELLLLGAAAAEGLQTHRTRTVVGFRGGGKPADWQPQSREEAAESLRTAWSLLLLARDRASAEARPPLTQRLAHGLRLMHRILSSEEVARLMRERDWSVEERVMLTSALRDVLQYEDLSEEARSEIAALHDGLLGDDLADQLRLVLATPVWDLRDSRAAVHETPRLLHQVASRLVADGPSGLREALETSAGLHDTATRYSLLRLLADEMGPRTVAEAALAHADWDALSAALASADAAGETDWTTNVLSRIAADHPERVPALLASLDVNDRRIDLALSLIESGRAEADPLTRIVLGGRARALSPGQVARLVEVVGRVGAEPAIAIAEQWIADHGDVDDGLKAVVHEVARAVVTTEATTMAEYYLRRLVERGVFDASRLIELWRLRMENRSGLSDELDEVLTDALLGHADEAFSPVLDLIRSGQPAFGFLSAAELRVLSKLAGATSVETVWTELQTWTELELRRALHHMDWSGGIPDPLVRAFLTSDRLELLESEAYVCFVNTLGVVVGPYHTALERELERARGWHEALAGTPAQSWTAKLIDRYESDIEWHRRREEEERVLLG